MIFKKTGVEHCKVTVNIPKDMNDRLENLALFFLCNKSEIIKIALKEYLKKVENKKEKLDKK